MKRKNRRIKSAQCVEETMTIMQFKWTSQKNLSAAFKLCGSGSRLLCFNLVSSLLCRQSTCCNHLQKPPALRASPSATLLHNSDVSTKSRSREVCGAASLQAPKDSCRNMEPKPCCEAKQQLNSPPTVYSVHMSQPLIEPTH